MTHDDIKVGSCLRNNDTRKKGETVVVEAITGRTIPVSLQDRHAIYRSNKRIARIRFDRIYVDGRPRARGYNLVAPVPAQS